MYDDKKNLHIPNTNNPVGKSNDEKNQINKNPSKDSGEKKNDTPITKETEESNIYDPTTPDLSDKPNELR